MTMIFNSAKTKIVLMLLLGTTFLLKSETASAQISDSKKTRIKRVENLVDKAGDLFKEKDYAGSADSIRDAQKELVKLAEGKNSAVVKQLKNDYERIVKAQGLLEGKGESFDSMPAYKSFLSDGSGSKGSGTKDGSDSKGSDTKDGSDTKGSDSKDGSDAKGSDTKDGSDTKGEDSEMVSFTKQIAPIFMEHCSQCHIQERRGRYDMTTYNSIKKGTRKGTAIKPRDLEKSRLIALVEGGKMPPRGKAPVPPEQLELLKTWVSQGAKFDGSNKQKNAEITEYVSTDGSGTRGEGSDSKAGSDSKSGSGSKNGLSTAGGGSLSGG